MNEMQFPSPGGILGPFGTGLTEIIKQSIHDCELYKKDMEQESYNFLINTIDDINFRKIADDLSYGDPLRIVETDGRMWAVVHHTIYDKYLRSEEHGRMVGKAPTAPIPIQSAILYGVASIEPSQIKNIVKEIRRIKHARWTDRDVQKSNVVKVTKVQV